MRCPYCDHAESRVIDSRDAVDGIRRRRECSLCGLRFTTYERIQTMALMVAKRDGRREEFDRQKLTLSLRKACAKRPLPMGAIEKIVDEMEGDLQGLGKAEIPASLIGRMVMDRLKGLDRVAYIRFASVYRDFRDIETFKEEVEALLNPREAEPQVPSNQLSFLEEETIPTPPRRRRARKPRRPQSEQA